MLCKNINKISPKKVLKGIFTNSDENGFLYLSLRTEKRVKQNLINECLAKLNNNYSNESNYYRNYLYLQEINYKIGEVYAAIYSPDKLFYRAKLMKDLDYDKVVVNFIDYGNSDILLKADLATLPEHISKIEPMIVICVIPNIRVVDKRRFANIFHDLCGYEVTVTIEGCCMFGDDFSSWTNNDSNDLLHLISFEYKKRPILKYLIDNGIAVIEEYNYQLINNGSYSSHPCSVNADLPVEQQMPSPDVTSNGVEYTKMAILIHVNSEQEFFVHEFHKEVKNRLENLQMVISRVVERYKSRVEDNFFNKRNVYLTQFNEDKLWYRCKITKFDPKDGFLVEFLDFGNHEYKESLSDLILLTSDMGEDVCYLINEEPVSHKCQLSPSLVSAFPAGANIKKYLIKTFVETSKKVNIVYHVKEDKEVVWFITNIVYHDKGLQELIKLHFVSKDPRKMRSHPSESVASSHSLHDAADVKVAEYLLNCCNMDGPDQMTDPGGAKECGDRTYLVTHVGEGLNDIWIDEGDGQSREMVDHILAATMNSAVPVNEVVIDGMYGVKVDMVMDVEGQQDRCLVRCRAVDVCDNFIEVHLVDKGTFIKVHIDDMFHISSDVMALPQQVSKFQLHSNLKLRSDEASVVERLRSLIENQYVRIVREVPSSTTLVDILIDNMSLVQALMSANIAILSENNNWFKTHRPCRHKCIQVSPSQIREDDLNGDSVVG